MSDFSKESVPPFGGPASGGEQKNGETQPPSRKLKAWRWGTRGFLSLVLLLAFSELFVLRGAFFRMVTPPPPPPTPREPAKAAKEGEQPKPVEFDPTDLGTVPASGPITPLDISDQQQLAAKAQELGDKVRALEEREGKIRERAGHLGQRDIRDTIWKRLVRGSLKDKATPKLWCENTAEEWGLFLGYGIAEPLDTVAGRILCGSASTIDASYLSLLENWTRTRAAHLEAWHERLNMLSAQLKKEEILKP